MAVLPSLLSVYYIFNSVLMFKISSDGKAPATWLHDKWNTISLKQVELIWWDLLGKCNDLFIVESTKVYFSLATFIQLHETEIEICKVAAFKEESVWLFLFTLALQCTHKENLRKHVHVVWSIGIRLLNSPWVLGNFFGWIWDFHNLQGGFGQYTAELSGNLLDLLLASAVNRTF